MIVLLSKRDAAARIGVNPATLMRMAKEGRFPVPVRLSDHLLAEHRFIESEVEDWITARIAARDAMAADNTPTPTKRGRGRPKGSKNKTTATEKPRHTKRKGHPSYATRIARGEKFEDLPAFARSKRED